MCIRDRAYSLDRSDLEERHNELFRAFQYVRTGFIHKQDVFLRRKFKPEYVIGVLIPLLRYVAVSYTHLYIPLDGHYVWQTTKNRRWFGPTKAGISLVWLIGRGKMCIRDRL